jgi:hypothetical protein
MAPQICIFLKGHMIGAPPVFLEHWGFLHSMVEAIWFSLPKIETCFVLGPLYKLYTMKVELVSKIYGIKLRCYWESLGELGKPIGKLIGTH